MKAQQILCVLPFFDRERTMYMPSGMSLTEISLLYAFVCLLYTFSEPTRRTPISYAVFCLKKKTKNVKKDMTIIFI